MRTFVASSKGWALLEGVADFLLFNAPTGVAIRLLSPAGGKLIPMKKTILWGDPVLDINRNSYGIVGINGSSHPGLSLAVYGEVRFRCRVDLVTPHDILCFDGLVYGVSNEGFIQAWDFNQMGKHFIRASDYVNCPSPTRVEHYQPRFNQRKESMKDHELRLLDALGELWLVSKSQFGNRVRVRVYRMDFKRRKWVDMDSLGGRVVFLCQNQSTVFSPLDPSKYKRDCVYFEEDGLSTDPGIYVYSVAHDSVEGVVRWRDTRT